MSVMVKVRHSPEAIAGSEESAQFLPSTMDVHALKDKMKCRCYLRVPWYSAVLWVCMLSFVCLSGWYVWRIEKLTSTLLKTEDMLSMLNAHNTYHGNWTHSRPM